MSDTCKSLRQGRSNPLAFPNRSSAAGWAPISLRLIVGYGSMLHRFARLSKVPDAFAFILQKVAQAYGRAICSGEVTNG
jgi:hypothetical protein